MLFLENIDWKRFVENYLLATFSENEFLLSPKLYNEIPANIKILTINTNLYSTYKLAVCF